MTAFRPAALALLALTTACATKAPGPVALAPPVCEDMTVSIYFERDSAEVIPEARGLLHDAAIDSRACKVNEVRVTGLADAIGETEVNLALSKRRAEAVSQVLTEEGFADVSFEVGAAGERGALTPAGEARPLRRRVDVMIRRAAS